MNYSDLMKNAQCFSRGLVLLAEFESGSSHVSNQIVPLMLQMTIVCGLLIK